MPYSLTRISQSDEGTFGIFKDESGEQLCVTVEPPPDVEHPCIPAGPYHCISHNGDHWKHVWELENVPGRSSILIHAGNYGDKDTKGCIIVGNSIGWIGTKQAVTNSISALNRLRNVLPNEFDIKITEEFSI